MSILRFCFPAYRFALAILAPALLFTAAAPALSVIPGAAGFGLETPAGRGGTVYRVTTLDEKGDGSLRACIDAKGPRVCIFEISGIIDLNGDLVVRNPNITVAGQTAPSPGILLRGGGLLIKTSDVLVQHLRVRPGDASKGTTPENRDALKIESTPGNPIHRIVVDHCSFGWSVDETVSVWEHWNEVSILNSVIGEPLNESIHPKGAHGYGLIIGPAAGNISVIGNLFAHIVARTPLTNATRAVIVNNVIYNWSGMATDLQSRGAATYNSVVGNVYVPGLDTTDKYKPILLRADSTALPLGSKVYLSDNTGEAGRQSWDLAGPVGGSLNMWLYRTRTPPVWVPGLTARPTSNNRVLHYVLRNAGARPADRDPVDKRIVQGVRDRTGQIINCVADNGTQRCHKNVGGWPALAVNRRTLTLPSDPNGVTSSGYTNLEVWLHGYSANVEGRKATPPPGPPRPLDVR